MCTVFVGIGSNIQKEHNLVSCIRTLQKSFGRLLISPIYESAAEGFEGDDFYNAVVSFKTRLDPQALHTLLRHIEEQHQRIRGDNKFISRTLDLDLLLYGDQVIQTASLKLPSADIQYWYILFPLADIAPDLKHPTLGRSFSSMKEASPQRRKYKTLDFSDLTTALNHTQQKLKT